MRIIDKDGNPILDYTPDMGYLIPTIVVKEDAVPIDDSTKFAWDDSDYEDAMMCIPNDPEIDLDAIKDKKVAESKESLATYLAENPLIWTDGNKYNVTEEKQSLLTSQLALYQTAITTGQSYILKWNTTGGVCTEWAYEDLVSLALSIGEYVQPLVSYQQTKEVEIMNCETAEAVEEVVIDYGTLA